MGMTSWFQWFLSQALGTIFLRLTKENAFLILCWESCVIQPEKIEIFSVMGRRRCQFSPPKDICRGLRLARNWYGLWPCFHDAQVPNGQCGITHNTQVQAKYMDSGWDILFTIYYLYLLFPKTARKAKYNFKCRIKVDTSVTYWDMQQPSCVIFCMRNVKYWGIRMLLETSLLCSAYLDGHF